MAVLEKDLAANLGLPVQIEYRPDGKGSVTIRFATIAEMDRLCAILGAPNR